MMIKKLLMIIGALIFTGCSATKISNFGEYKSQPLVKTSFMPAPEMVNGHSARVVVFKLDEGDNLVSKQSGLGETISVSIENVLTSNNLATLIDRNAAKKLEKEIALVEMNKTGSYKGPQIADYAISGTIGNASFTKQYNASRPSYNPQTKSITMLPPQFTYTANVSGNIKVYELPSMKVTYTIQFSGKKSRTENVQSDNSVSLMGIVQFSGTENKGVDRDDNLVRKAGAEAINNIAYQIKNCFARTAYILEKRVFKSKTIFKINLGSNDGLKANDEFDVIGQYEVENILINQNEIERRKIAKGKVTDQINSDSAWVVIDNKKDINNIRLGDMVKFKYELGFIGKLSEMIGAFN